MDTSRAGISRLAFAASDEQAVDLLKTILENLPSPERLDDHPWVRSRLVANEREASPSLKTRRPGIQLAVAVARLFRRMLPPAPPRRGKRLDTRWGEFGLLASRYFAPFMFGLPYPSSLRQAWGGIDEAILLFAYDRPLESDDPRVVPYQFIAGESGVAPESTLSDWHRSGIRRLADAAVSRERYLRDYPALRPDEDPATAPRRRTLSRPLRIALLSAVGLALAALLILGGLKVRRIDLLTDSIGADAASLREVAGTPSIKSLLGAAPHLSALRRDLEAFQAEVEPLLWLGPLLDWVPVYGGDLASASDLLDFSVELSASADEACRAAVPVLETIPSGAALDLPSLTRSLQEMQPALQESRRLLERAQAAHTRLEGKALSPRLQDLLGSASLLMDTFDDSLSAAIGLPRLLGATSEGPKTYLILLQNEDELRPTGGYITAVGTLVLRNGAIVTLEFENSTAFDDWSKAYPPAPWQMQRYMDIPILVLRDANWYTDFRTAALNAEYLYSLGRGHSVDGIFALDQHMLVTLLGAIGPIDLSDAASPITLENVTEYMRSAKLPPEGEPVPLDWDPKAFIGPLARAILQKLLAGTGMDWAMLSKVLLASLNERHLLLQLDDASLSKVIAHRGWDGAVTPGAGDFLLVADANVGYTKSNAVLESRIVYDVDLSDPVAPEGLLTLVQKNNAPRDVPCLVAPDWNHGVPDLSYPADRCYLGYVRVYKNSGTRLIDATPHPVPASAMLLEQAVPAVVDRLGEEVAGTQAFGTLVLVPGGQTVHTGLRFALPPAVSSSGPRAGQLAYRLKIQKQAGTGAVPVTLRIHLPSHARLISVPEGAIVQGGNVLLEAALARDLSIEVVFSLP